MSSQTTRFFAVKVTVGQERNVARILEGRVLKYVLENDKVVNIEKTFEGVHSIIILPNIRGYIFVEADNKERVSLLVQGIRHVKARPPLPVKFEEISQHLIEKPIIEMISVGDVVEIVSGPLRGIYGKVVRIDKPKNEVTIEPVDATFPLPISIPADQVRMTQQPLKSKQ
ncbi:MAG: transcription elongation factor Spt5 [Nitrososphaerota archaeon]|nr:transcription elongation factor Spt5 [Candidatus Geocrenenecus dongiae]